MRREDSLLEKQPNILVLIPTLNDDPTSTVSSIRRQTITPSEIIVVVGSRSLFCKLLDSHIVSRIKVVYLKPDMSEYLGIRVAKSLNYALNAVNLKEFDYILKVDADVELPPSFIEKNLEVGGDVVGKCGCALLIRNEIFLSEFNGRFPKVPADDTFFNLLLMSRNKKVKGWKIKPIMKTVRKHSWRHYSSRGSEYYKLGYEPLHIFELLRFGIENVFLILGYLVSIIKRIDKYEISSWVFQTQLRRVIYGKH